MPQCAGAPKKGYASCNALRVTSGTTAFQEERAARKGIAPQTVRPNAAADSSTGCGPSDLQSAYGLTSADPLHRGPHRRRPAKLHGARAVTTSTCADGCNGKASPPTALTVDCGHFVSQIRVV
ncbi:hypothetical protein J2Z21_000759 [Streptomyces griseochromogenes]|uniref:Uncharacterized protein n=1 Tax=Streptomyces griseochromogenes TaxID=68214 RepID=A0ABS4LKB1_9ACTN|nr:hypothetical protein [Streptomyces griseochromogenes]